MAEEWGNNLILYLYDADGTPIGMQYRNTSYAEGVFDTYWYEKNLQGDIVAVYNQAGTKLIAYTYDAWGNSSIIYSSGVASTTATYNPFRYRGYYFDSESGFYYLHSGYYDPAISRFISPDAYINANGDILGFNMYAYTNNNSINFSYNNSITTRSISGKDRIICSIGDSNHSTGTPNSRSFSKGRLWLADGLDTGSTING